MKSIIIVVLIFGWATMAAAAPRGDAFLHGMHSPAELAAVIQGNLASYPDGQHKLDPVSCQPGKHDRSCAAPVDYLEKIQEIDPKAHLTKVEQLPAYLYSLESRPAPQGQYYWLACKTLDGKPLLHCVRRKFKPGEQVWVNPKTKVMILASDCTNPIQGPDLPQQCVYIRLEDFKVADVRLKQYGPTDISSDPCTALKRAGETEWESPFVEKCPDKHCSFTAVDRALGEQGWQTGSFPVSEHGVDVLRLPAKFAEQGSKYRMVFCVDREVDGKIEHSCGMGVQWFDYVPKGNTKVATIYSDETSALIARAQTVLGAPTELWWRFLGDICH